MYKGWTTNTHVCVQVIITCSMAYSNLSGSGNIVFPQHHSSRVSLLKNCCCRRIEAKRFQENLQHKAVGCTMKARAYYTTELTFQISSQALHKCTECIHRQRIRNRKNTCTHTHTHAKQTRLARERQRDCIQNVATATLQYFIGHLLQYDVH